MGQTDSLRNFAAAEERAL